MLASTGPGMISLLWIFLNLKAGKMTLQKINDSLNSAAPQSHLTHVNSCSEAYVRCQRVGCQTLQDMIQVRSLEMSSPLP